MRVLVDTAAWLWLATEPHRFSAERAQELAAPETEILVSIASAWEIAIKYSVGKLPLPDQPARYVPYLLERTLATSLPIDQSHVLRVAELPLHHRDPFDRLLIAQAQIEQLPIVSNDPWFSKYDVHVLSPR